MFTTVFILIAISLALSLTLTPIVRAVALRWRLVDLPDNNRKVHRKPVARIGGVAIFVAYFGSFLAIAAIFTHGALSTFTVAKSLAPAALLIFLAGVLDDVIGLKPWHKLAAEIAAGGLVIWAGIYLRGVPTSPHHPVLGAFCTIAWLVLSMNAVNLIDGLDGLAAGIALLATITILAASLFHGSVQLTLIAAPLVGALLGFLVFNSNPASIFLGDSGSLLIGFLLGCYGILWSGNAATLPKMAMPVIALAVPLTDTTLAIVRRLVRAQPIFSPDRSHIHHRLLARGFSHRHAVLLLYAAAGVAGVFALWLIAAGKLWEPFIIVAVAVGAVLGIRQLGYAELESARRILTCHAFQEEVNAQLAVRSFEDRLAAAATPDDCWTVIRDASQDFGFRPVHMRLEGQLFSDEQDPVPTSCWTLRMPISQGDWIELFHKLGPVDHASAVVSFVETIRRVLVQKHAVLAPPIRRRAAFAASAGLLHHK
jgi:UDP-GlcNAc:undecaprenyl-phosphate/decaprenyl-phosphate GlcNAc-1-phosphate transferase